MVNVLVLSVLVIVNVMNGDGGGGNGACRCWLKMSVIVRCAVGAGAVGGVDTGRRLWRCCRVEEARLPMIVVDGRWMSGIGVSWNGCSLWNG